MIDINQISQNTIDRYTKRYDSFGKDIKTLGWGSEEQQIYRFKNTIQAVNFNDKSILDIGCGFGDYSNFLKKQSINIKSYTGWDINPVLIEEANVKASELDTFSVFNLANDPIESYINKYDIGVMLGLLNFNLGSTSVNWEYSKMMLKQAFALVNHVLIVDFISSKLFRGYPTEDFIYYHNPSQVVDFALELTDNVVLKHNYAPIPQKEFMLYIYK
jgi:SAM-dependent methyltransferase